MKIQLSFKNRFVRIAVVLVAIVAIRYVVPQIIDWAADYDATQDTTTSDADLRAKFLSITDLNNTVTHLQQTGLKCITDKATREKNSTALTGLVMPYVNIDPWLEKNYTRAELQKSIAFLSGNDGKAYVDSTVSWFDWLLEQTQTAPDGHPVTPDIGQSVKQLGMYLRDYAKDMNYVQKERFMHFIRQGLGQKLITFYAEALKQFGEITNTAAINHPDLDREISPLLAPYYVDFRNDNNISCRQTVQ